MHKKMVNELRLSFSIAPRGPLLIKSGKESGADPTLLDMNFVRLHHAGLGRETVYLPGSSLKGTLRSYCEKIARTVGEGTNRQLPFSCNPLGNSNKPGAQYACGRYFDKHKDASSAQKFAGSCAICRIFGHTGMAAHLSLSDAYPWDASAVEAERLALWEKTNHTEQRNGVAIDRVSGAVAVGPFNLEVVTQGDFLGELALKNFQLWQIGLLGIALRDLARERIPIGFSKSRGLGRVSVNLRALEVAYPGQFAVKRNGRDLSAALHGVTAFLDEKSVTEYDYRVEEALPPPTPGTVAELGDEGRVSLRWTEAKAIEDVLRACAPAWAQFVQAWRGEGG